MKAKSLSANILGNTIKKWADHCSKDENYDWTKHDANALYLLLEEVKRQRHEVYIKYKEDGNLKKNTIKKLS